jgi:hypothetical protein
MGWVTPTGAIVVKILFGLMRKSLFNIVHSMTDLDSSLGSSFIVGNSTESNEIP